MNGARLICTLNYSEVTDSCGLVFLTSFSLSFGYSMTYGVTVRDLCIRFNPQSLNIDERCLIHFGLQHSLIRRLHCYPILVPPTPSSCTEDSPSHRGHKRSAIHSMCTGQHSFDEICCKFGLTYKELNDRVERDSNILVLWK